MDGIKLLADRIRELESEATDLRNKVEYLEEDLKEEMEETARVADLLERAEEKIEWFSDAAACFADKIKSIEGYE